MNAKKAKALRRAAHEMTVGQPHVAYQPLVPKIIHSTLVPVPGAKTALFLGHVHMAENCTRRVYQLMKKRSDQVIRSAAIPRRLKEAA